MLELIDCFNGISELWDSIVDLFTDDIDDINDNVEAMATHETLNILDNKVISMIVEDITDTNPNIDEHTATTWAKKIVEESVKYKINPFLIASQAKQESTWNPMAIGRDNDMGLLQIMNNTAKDIAKELGYKNFRPEMLKDPLVNIEFSAYYLHYCYDRTANYIGNDMANRDWLAIASYNMGVIPAVKNYISGKLGITNYVNHIKKHFLDSYDGIDIQF